MKKRNKGEKVTETETETERSGKIPRISKYWEGEGDWGENESRTADKITHSLLPTRSSWFWLWHWFRFLPYWLLKYDLAYS